ncbi:MAG: class I adenylate-forming enzyme family protein [Acidimicrobiales bacterium]
MLTDISRRAAVDFADTPAFVTDPLPNGSWSITYAELDRAADEAAAGLVRRGVGERSVVALVLPSVIDYVVLFLAAARLGAVTAGLNPRFRPAENRHALGVLRPDLVITTSELADGCDAVSCPVEIIEPGVDPTSVSAAFRVAGASPAPPLADDPERPVCICFTSGSTGQPRGAWYANRQLTRIAELDSGGAWGGGGHGLSSTQFAHVGFMTKLPWMMATGRTTHLLDRWRADAVLDLIVRYKMPAVTGVAPQIALLLRLANIADHDFDHVKAIVVGGSASPPALVHRAREVFGAPYSIRYSSTESGGIGIGTALDADDEEALHTIGRPRPGVEAEIRDPEGHTVSAGEVGELWLRSDVMMSGYWNDPQSTAATIVDGWLRTGDLALIDPSGAFRLQGRSTEMYIRGGYNVYPMEVESVLVDHPSIAEVCVIPRPDDVMGEIGVACVVPVDGATAPSLDALRAFAAARLSHHKLPEQLRRYDELPRNASDKVDRLRLIADEPPD